MSDSLSIALSLLGGQAGGASVVGIYSGNPVAALRLAEQRKDKELERTAKRPEVERELKAFRAALDKADTPEALLKDRRALGFLLQGFGLASQANFTALAERALLGDPRPTDALVRRLDNSAWRAMAETLKFAETGLATLRKPETLVAVEDSFIRTKWFEEIDAQQPGLSDAIDFKQRAPVFTNVFAILGDPITRRVVTGALGLPQGIVVQSVETQARAIQSRLDVKSLQNPKKVEALAQRYLLNQASASPSSLSTAQTIQGGGSLSVLTSLALQSRTSFLV